MPDGTAGKPVHDGYAEPGGGAGRIRKRCGGARAYAFRVAVSPDRRGQNRFVSFVDQVAYRLTDQMVADRPDFQSVFGQQIVAALAIAILRQRLVHLEMISPTGQFQAVVSPAGRFFRQRFEGHIRPLSRE